MSILIWCIVQTIVCPMFIMFLRVLITIIVDVASRPNVDSSTNTIEGLATNSTAIVRPFPCSVDKRQREVDQQVHLLVEFLES